MQELVGGKNTIGRTAAVLKKPHKATFTFYLTTTQAPQAHLVPSLKKEEKYTFTTSWAFISHSRVNITFNCCSMAQERECQGM